MAKTYRKILAAKVYIYFKILLPTSYLRRTNPIPAPLHPRISP